MSIFFGRRVTLFIERSTGPLATPKYTEKSALILLRTQSYWSSDTSYATGVITWVFIRQLVSSPIAIFNCWSTITEAGTSTLRFSFSYTKNDGGKFTSCCLHIYAYQSLLCKASCSVFASIASKWRKCPSYDETYKKKYLYDDISTFKNPLP